MALELCDRRMWGRTLDCCIVAAIVGFVTFLVYRAQSPVTKSVNPVRAMEPLVTVAVHGRSLTEAELRAIWGDAR